MSDRHPVAILVDAVRRQWWLVAAVVAVALAVAYVVTRDAKPEYTGSARVSITSSMTNRAGIARPDDMISAVTDDERIRSLAASESDLPEERFATDVGAYTTGDPQSALFVTLTSEDKAEAEQGAIALAKAAVVRARELSKAEIDKARAQVELTTSILQLVQDTDFRANALRTQSEADLAKTQTEFSYKMQLVGYQSGLDAVLSVYTYDGNVETETKPASKALRDAAVGAGFLGLVAGIVLAAVRDAFRRRRAASAVR